MARESSKEKKARKDREKALRDRAKEEIRGYEAQFEVDRDITTGADTGEGAFISETAPNVHKAVIDKGSGRGYVEITGGGLAPYWVRTSPDGSGIEVVELKHAGQTCMIHGQSSLLYIRPRR